MKNHIWSTIGIILLSIAWSACGSDANNESKTPWTAKERQEFRDGCFLSTRFSFEQSKQVVDSASIVTICDCTASEIEAQYNFSAAKRIPKAEINKILELALSKCAPEAVLNPAVDSATFKK